MYVSLTVRKSETTQSSTGMAYGVFRDPFSYLSVLLFSVCIFYLQNCLKAQDAKTSSMISIFQGAQKRKGGRKSKEEEKHIFTGFHLYYIY